MNRPPRNTAATELKAPKFNNDDGYYISTFCCCQPSQVSCKSCLPKFIACSIL